MIGSRREGRQYPQFPTEDIGIMLRGGHLYSSRSPIIATVPGAPTRVCGCLPPSACSNWLEEAEHVQQYSVPLPAMAQLDTPEPVLAGLVRIRLLPVPTSFWSD